MEEKGRATRRIFIDRCLDWKIGYNRLTDILAPIVDTSLFADYYAEYVSTVDPLMQKFFYENWNMAYVEPYSDTMTYEFLMNPDKEMFRTRGSYAAMYYSLIRVLKPQRIVETGVWFGMSSFSILHALKRNGGGHLWSIDFNDNKLIGSLVSPDLRQNWTLIIGDTTNELPKLLDQLKQVDVVFLDDEHSLDHVTFEAKAAWPHLTKNGVLALDDIDWYAAGFFGDFSSGKKSCLIQRLPAGIDVYGANIPDPAMLERGRKATIGFIIKP